MKRLKINLNVEQDARLEAYLELMNGILKLTPTQLEVLTRLVKYNPKVVTPNSRKEIARQMGFKNVAVVNNFIKVLRDKSVILRNEETGLYYYNPTVIPPEQLESVEFVFGHEQ